MFERFTDRARRVLVLAQEQARLLNHNFIGTEHILLGLIQEGDGIAAKALEQLGIGLEPVREKVEQIVHPAASWSTGSPPFTPRAKKVLELSLREALQLGHNYIGTEHLLLGLLREGEGVATQVLVNLGAELVVVRQQVIRLISGYQSPQAEGAGEVSIIGERDGPRCPACRLPLDGHVGYRVLPVPPVGESETSDPIDVIFVYCRRCGVLIAHTPAGDRLAHTPAGDRRRYRDSSPHDRPTSAHQGRSEQFLVAATDSIPAGVGATPEQVALNGFGAEAGAYVVDVRYEQPDHAVVQVGFPDKAASYWKNVFRHADGWRLDLPAGQERVVAEGVTTDGVRWTLTAGGNDDSYSTMLRTEDAVGVIDSGGMGGPKLWGTARLNVYTGSNPERGPLGVVVRCHPSIVRVVLVAEPGVEMDLNPCGNEEIDGLRFGVILVEPATRLREIVGYGRGKTGHRTLRPSRSRRFVASRSLTRFASQRRQHPWGSR